jgi:hypothetical protein
MTTTLPDQPMHRDDGDATSRAAGPTPADPWTELRRHTPARLALGRAGTSLPTPEVLRFAAAHAAARDAVHLPLDVDALLAELRAHGLEAASVASRRPRAPSTSRGPTSAAGSRPRRRPRSPPARRRRCAW